MTQNIKQQIAEMQKEIKKECVEYNYDYDKFMKSNTIEEDSFIETLKGRLEGYKLALKSELEFLEKIENTTTKRSSWKYPHALIIERIAEIKEVLGK